jgi:hypothetical protein
MARHRLTETHYTILLLARDGETDFSPRRNEGKLHAAALELLGFKFGEPMLRGVNSFTVEGLTPAGEATLAKHLNQ